VPGLGGSVVDTWTHVESNTCWLRDFLPVKSPKARIFTFDYDASAAFGRSNVELLEIGMSLMNSLVARRTMEKVGSGIELECVILLSSIRTSRSSS
jgi:hypothetical protein